MTDLISPKEREPFESLLPDEATRAKRRSRRKLRDGISRWGITTAGFGVVFSLALIFIYLFYEVMPIFKGASLEEQVRLPLPALEEGQQVERLWLERYQELGLYYTDDAKVRFFEVDTGTVRNEFTLNVPDGAEVTSFANGEDIGRFVAYGLSDGSVVSTRHAYDLSFPNDVRYIQPKLEFPFGTDPVVVDQQGRALTALGMQVTTRGAPTMGVVGFTEDRRLVMGVLTARANLMTGETTIQANRGTLPAIPGNASVTKIMLDKTLRNVFVIDDRGRIHYYDTTTPANARLIQTIDVGEPITAIDFLVGSVSMIIGTESGSLSQWFLVRDANNEYTLQRVRDFKAHRAAITSIAPEYTRKGFLVGDASGVVGIHYGTSARTLLQKRVNDAPVIGVAVSQINERALTLTADNQVIAYELWNRHPQISMRALWNKVWYEGRSDPEYIWQSSSASDEFESKFSLIPLSLGTLKAAFFAMMFAMPLGLLGAVYTAYFMTPKLRGKVKPVIEIMEALPTVILGFLAGLWLAPFMENHLPAVFSILIGMPLLMIGVAALWRFVPKVLSGRIPPGWEAVILIPFILFFGWLCVTMSPIVEIAFFDGSMRQWFTNVGITYDQRNAMVVGVAMGFAVIPTIYSIAEDAVFNVPKHLTQGSLALGATSWQTVMGVVIPTASPGIFSAIMIGFGRAIGETMIVLMATGNSPIVNFNIFEGMRTLSANIAVELPETAVGGTHFRILFLAALVLFIVTFIFNTIAEVVRQRLRRRYSSL
ncbi:ABC transporter permease subunit [Salinispirillum sp. LH 10-3-1]|uniref:ABC transporter permease subunit n=1 Tax=Salinispirillum sp. LH 10-3-1 TaxID=2952525 RepID=A0AB38YFF0_9GAMM